jgi:hypothetical protein
MGKHWQTEHKVDSRAMTEIPVRQSQKIYWLSGRSLYR